VSGGAALRRRPRDQQVVGHVARRVRDLRLARAVTQEELAAYLGVKRESMSRYESGERAISIAMLLDIAEALEQPVSAFLPGPAAGPQPAQLAEIVAALRAQPDLIPSVQDLLAALRENHDQDRSG
jgi:transcriptional regulator with XRE-family HTH domain